MHRHWLRGLGWVLGVLVVAGCRSPSGSQPPKTALIAATWPEEKIAAAHAHYSAAVIHEMNEEPEAALQEYYQAAINDPTDESVAIDVAERFTKAKQPEKALEVLKPAADWPTSTGEVWAKLGTVYAQLGKSEQSLAANKTAIKRSPELLAGYQNLYLTYVQNKKPDEAAKVLEEAARQEDVDGEFLITLSELFSNLGTTVPAQKANARAKSLALLNRAAKFENMPPPLRLQLAEGFNAAGDYAKAAQLYLELLKRLPDIPLIRERVHARLTDIYLRDQDHTNAMKQLEAIMRDDPTNPQAAYWLGSIALDDKKPAQAVDWFKKAIVLDPQLEQAYYDLAVAQIELNQGTNALQTLQQARQKFSQTFALEFFSGLAYGQQKDYTNALRHYTAAEVIARATDPKRLTEHFYFQLGAASERSGDLVQAEKYFQKSLQLAPNFADSLNYLGYMWAEHG
ncbi:MAG TPA: tetratricopeptide repeat protein, partial [Candidatus Dormibacteraeota bacterium]|nr:tetratricopeptide repeat protein [Candidatus Dormibacteraeota bacterium]